MALFPFQGTLMPTGDVNATIFPFQGTLTLAVSSS
jgi:hypothetical protein